MFEQNKPMTHIVWAQHYQGARFREWVEIGRGRVEPDGNGGTTVHVFTNRIPRGDSGYMCLLPIGIKPKDPEQQPKRPANPADHEDEF